VKNLTEVLRSVEQSVQVVEDTELRKIAFQELLRESLIENRSSQIPYRDKKVDSSNERKGKRRPSPPGRSGSDGSARTEVARLDLSPDEPALVRWDSLTLDWKKFCWILEAARLNGVDGLTNSEIGDLIGRVFRESFEPKVVSNLKDKIKAGFVKSSSIQEDGKTYAVWKILRAGITEVTRASGGTESK